MRFIELFCQRREGLRRKQLRLLGAILLLALLLVGCEQEVTKPHSKIALALAFAPVGVEDFAFTDWELHKNYTAFPSITSSSDKDERQRFLRALALYWSGSLPGTSGDQMVTSEMVQRWSWDALDLTWEAVINPAGEGGSIYISKFHNDFDLATVLARYRERNYQESEYAGATVYTHENDGSDWIIPEYSFLNTAVLSSEKILLRASQIEQLHSILDTYRQTSGGKGFSESLEETVSRSGPLADLVIRPASELCPYPQLGPGASDLSPDSPVAKAMKAKRFEELIIGYHVEAKRPLGLLAIHYANSGDAEADLPIRTEAARDGPSLILGRGKPYHDFLFTVNQTRVEGSDIVIEVQPVRDQPSYIFTKNLYSMLFRQDMLFAACP